VDTSSNPFYNPTHNYILVSPPSQTFEVKCIAVNNTGCIDSVSHILQVNNPYPAFNSPNMFPCLPLGGMATTTFVAGGGFSTYSLNFGDSPQWQTLQVMNPIVHNYYPPGIYNPTLTVTDVDGCKATETLTITALGQPTAIIQTNGGNKF